jgi:predicted amidohydrolase
MKRDLNMTLRCAFIRVAALLIAGLLFAEAGAKNLKVAVVQTIIEPRLEDNLTKVLGFIDRARKERCRLVVLPEHGLLPFEAPNKPTKAELDAVFETIRLRARSAGLCVVFSDGYRRTEGGAYQTYGIVYTEDGTQAVFYRKNLDVPRPFIVDGVSCNLSVCSDRGYLEHSDLPCLTLGTQIIIDSSGGHGGDDGGKELPLIRYRPWAARTGAWVIVCNPVHEDTDFMGRSPWGGGSAIIRPDGSVLAALTYEKDTMIVEQIDMDLASRAAAKQRLNHPLFMPFWEQGKALLLNGSVGLHSNIKPFTSKVRNIKIAAAQMACSRDMHENANQINREIRRAAQQEADIVVFPELAVTGSCTEDIRAATPDALDGALDEICAEAKLHKIYVVVGMPIVTGHARYNGAVVIGDDGKVKTGYEQLVVSRTHLFQPGLSTKSMWFSLKGVPSIITVGDDANWVEIGDLAANRGMYLHFHISYESDASSEQATLRKQRNLLALRYARYGAVVNAADPSGLKNPSEPAGGMSMLVSREGGHNQPAPKGIEYYLPYQTSIVKSTGTAPAMIVAMRRTSTANNMDLTRFWRNRNRRQGGQPARLDWISNGAALIGLDELP